MKSIPLQHSPLMNMNVPLIVNNNSEKNISFLIVIQSSSVAGLATLSLVDWITSLKEVLPDLFQNGMCNSFLIPYNSLSDCTTQN